MSRLPCSHITADRYFALFQTYYDTGVYCHFFYDTVYDTETPCGGAQGVSVPLTVCLVVT